MEGGGEEEPNQTTARKPDHLLNTLWYTLYRHTYGRGRPLRPVFKAGKNEPFKVKSKVKSSALPIIYMYVPVLYSVHSLPTS